MYIEEKMDHTSYPSLSLDGSVFYLCSFKISFHAFFHVFFSSFLPSSLPTPPLKFLFVYLRRNISHELQLCIYALYKILPSTPSFMYFSSFISSPYSYQNISFLRFSPAPLTSPPFTPRFLLLPLSGRASVDVAVSLWGTREYVRSGGQRQDAYRNTSAGSHACTYSYVCGEIWEVAGGSSQPPVTPCSITALPSSK